jgi:cell division protein FtsW
MPSLSLRTPAWLAPRQDAPDWTLLLLVAVLISFGVIMVASASIDYAARSYGDPWFFVKRHLVFLALAASGCLMVYSVPVVLWNRFSIVLLLVGVALLAAVLIPGIGKSVNGARRWFSLGPISVQASEVAKFCFIIFFASFLSRRRGEFQTRWREFFKLIGILGVFVLLLLLEPDFGSAVVLCITAGAMMFLAGVPLIRFILLALAGVVGLALLAVATPYRWQRLVTFLDPWANQYDEGYQLVQSLIGFGRGEWAGLGLGNSLQKLFFLPEAHTDFIFAIVAEEFGLIGAVTLVLGFSLLVWRILAIARLASEKKRPFIAYTSVGTGVLFAAQAFINMGVASGLLPTKGLTLPFVSAGGSSLIVSCAFIALLVRMHIDLVRIPVGSGQQAAEVQA